jgi:hydrogenase nickel incorporation protein HypA/HybF
MGVRWKASAMHELSLAGGILQLVEEAAAREGFKRVESLRLSAGALSGVDVHALRFALEAMAAGTLLAGAHVDIEEPLATAFCFGCGSEVQMASRADACSACGAYRLTPRTGTELRVIGLTVLDE